MWSQRLPRSGWRAQLIDARDRLIEEIAEIEAAVVGEPDGPVLRSLQTERLRRERLLERVRRKLVSIEAEIYLGRQRHLQQANEKMPPVWVRALILGFWTIIILRAFGADFRLVL